MSSIVGQISYAYTDTGPSAEVKEARKRILVMEYIQGGRVDDLVYLADHNIDRNKVSLELARIFCQMVHINGFFHAVSQQGNLSPRS